MTLGTTSTRRTDDGGCRFSLPGRRAREGRSGPSTRSSSCGVPKATPPGGRGAGDRPGGVPQQEDDGHHVVERSDHRQELRDQVDRGEHPQDRDQQGDLGAHRYVGVAAQAPGRRDAGRQELDDLLEHPVREPRGQEHHQSYASEDPQPQRHRGDEEKYFHIATVRRGPASQRRASRGTMIAAATTWVRTRPALLTNPSPHATSGTHDRTVRATATR